MLKNRTVSVFVQSVWQVIPAKRISATATFSVTTVRPRHQKTASHANSLPRKLTAFVSVLMKITPDQIAMNMLELVIQRAILILVVGVQITLTV